MERDTLLSHGISMFLQESMMERSDKYAWAACKNCGTLVALNIASNINECKNCNNDDISIVRTPYAFKLLIQEFEAMGVQLRINTEEIDIPSEYTEPYIYKGKITNGEDIVLEEEDEEDEEDEVDDVDDVDDVDEKISKMQWKELYDDSFNESDKKKGGYIKKGNNYKREDVEENNEIKGGDYDSNEDEEVGSEERNEEGSEEGSEEGREEGYNEYDDVMNGGDYESDEEDEEENNKELEGGGKYDIDEDYEYDNEEKNINNKNEEFFGGNDVTDSESESTASSEEDDNSDGGDEGQEGGNIYDTNKSTDNGKDFIKIIDILE
jgi:hypothetical protein